MKVTLILPISKMKNYNKINNNLNAIKKCREEVIGAQNNYHQNYSNIIYFFLIQITL